MLGNELINTMIDYISMFSDYKVVGITICFFVRETECILIVDFLNGICQTQPILVMISISRLWEDNETRYSSCKNGLRKRYILLAEPS